MQPYNYTIQAPNPFESALGGLKLGFGLQDMQAQRQAHELKLQQEQQKANLATWETFSKERQARDLQSAGQIMAAFQSGAPEIGLKMLRERAEAANNSGDTEQAKALETWAKIAELNPSAVTTSIGLMVAQLPGGDKVIESVTKLGTESRAEAEAPVKLAELEAKAIAAGVAAEFARPMAIAELNKTKAETLAPSVRESIDYANLKPEQQRIFQGLQILKKPPAAVTNVNVSNIDKSAAAELGKLVPDLYNQANSAASQLGELPRYKAALNSAITGPFADQRLSTARVANALGFTGDKAVNASREVIQGLSEMALKSRSMLTGQGQITDSEQKLLLQARSGDINFTKGELQTIFGVAERAAKAQYTQSRKLLESASKQSPTAQMFLDNMQPLAQQETPKPTAAQAAPAASTGMPAGFRVIR